MQTQIERFQIKSEHKCMKPALGTSVTLMREQGVTLGDIFDQTENIKN